MEMKELIGKGESQNLEFKESLRLKEEIGEPISAFSNSGGGEPIGVEIGGNTIEELANYIKRNTDPQVFPSVKTVEVGEKFTGMNWFAKRRNLRILMKKR